MEDDLSLQPEEFIVKRMVDSKEQRCRNLIAGIIYQAVMDYQKFQSMSARHFIDKKNKLFCFYCDILGLEPEFVAKKLQRNIYRYINERN